jgi:hypothetical protein
LSGQGRLLRWPLESRRGAAAGNDSPLPPERSGPVPGHADAAPHLRAPLPQDAGRRSRQRSPDRHGAPEGSRRGSAECLPGGLRRDHRRAQALRRRPFAGRAEGQRQVPHPPRTRHRPALSRRRGPGPLRGAAADGDGARLARRTPGLCAGTRAGGLRRRGRGRAPLREDRPDGDDELAVGEPPARRAREAEPARVPHDRGARTPPRRLPPFQDRRGPTGARRVAARRLQTPRPPASTPEVPS